MASSLATWGNDLYTGKKSYNIVGRSRTWFLVAAIAVGLSILLLFTKQLQPGIEFRGGAEFVVANPTTMSQQVGVDTVLAAAPEAQPRVSVVGGTSLRIQTGELTEETVDQLKADLAEAYGVDPGAVTSSFVGPSWGKDVTTKALRGMGIFIVLVSLVMTAYFRNWRMAAAGIIALFHDLAVTVGVYALIGWEVTPATAIGLLTILGYSLYDTVVVFDKVRENTAGFLDQRRNTYAELANLAVNQTLVRSINTSVVAILPVASILFFGAFILGAGTLRDIALALFVGMSVGAYSSIFLATPLEVWLRSRERPVVEHNKKVAKARAATAAKTGVEAPAVAGALKPGMHLGQKAQPKRRKNR
jgi:preprotein translocase subunit SecF